MITEDENITRMNKLICLFESTVPDIKVCHHLVELIKVCILKKIAYSLIYLCIKNKAL